MRVTIEHREQSGGITGARRTYFVDCTVQFSEEERAIIKARDLYETGFDIHAANPLPSRVAYVGSGLIRSIGRLLILGGVGLGIYVVFAHTSGGDLGYLMFFAGICLEIYGWWRGRQQDKRIEQPEQTITIRRLLSKPRFTVHAYDPASAKVIEHDIRSNLEGLKQTIQVSAELKPTQSFEL